MPVYFNGRLTTEETKVYWRYGIDGGYADEDHVASLVVPTTLSAGEYRLRINGWETGPIDVTTADQGPALEAAIEAIVDRDGDAVFPAGDVVAAGTDPNYTLTFAVGWANTPIIIEVFQLDGDTAIAGGTLDDIVVGVDTQGGGQIELSGHIMDINTSQTQEAVDVTAMGEVVRNESTTVRTGQFDMRVYHASQNFLALIREGSTGVLTVYESGVGAGRPYFRQQVLIKQADVSRPAFDKIEISLSGTYQGEPLTPFGSFQPVA